MKFGLVVLLLVAACLAVAGYPRVSHASSGVPFSQPQSGVLQRPSGPITYQRLQFGARGSSSYLVWTEKNRPVGDVNDDLFDTHDVTGMNLTTNSAVSVATLAGNQTEPAISGSIVVWEDNARTCPTCQQDILGKDLSNGTTFTVASGGGDNSHPPLTGVPLLGSLPMIITSSL